MVRHDIIGGAAGLVAGAAKKPFGVAGHAFGLAKGTVVTGVRMARDATTYLRESDPRNTGTGATTAGDSEPQRLAAEARQAPTEPQVVLREPGPPEEPPIDVVGQALAAEAADAPPTRAEELLTGPDASSDDTRGATAAQASKPLADPALVAQVLAEKQVGDAASDPDKG